MCSQHHLAGEDHAARVDLVLVGILRGGAVGGLEDGVPGVVVDVAAGGDADAADASGQRVADVVAVEVHGGDHAVFGRAGENLLEKRVGDHVLDDDLFAALGILQGLPRPTVEVFRPEVRLGHLVAPIA
jgi:hypothetical protein